MHAAAHTLARQHTHTHQPMCHISHSVFYPADEKWVKHPVAVKELAKAVAAATTLLRTQACTASQACLSGSASTPGGAAAVAETGALLPGAVLAKTPGGWSVMVVEQQCVYVSGY